MIVYIDLEHDKLAERPELHERLLARRLKQKYRFEEISGDLCLLVRYWRVSPDLLRKLDARAVLISGAATDFEHYTEESLAGLRAIYREAAWPTLGLCAGLQMMAETYGAPIGSMGRLPAGEPDPYAGTTWPQGVRQERGFMRVRVNQPHPLLANLGSEPTFFESHYWDVKATPAGFHLLAETDLCGVQMIGHGERPMFGVQFHPEEYDAEHPDGRTLLENFFRVAGVLA